MPTTSLGQRLGRRIGAVLHRFRRDTGGMAAIEMAMVLPIYLFCTIGLFTYWDAWRVINTGQKASYTISDLISREMEPVRENYVQGLFDTMTYMMGPTLPTQTRITSVFYSQPSNEYRVIWSRSSASNVLPRHTNSSLRNILSDMPTLHDGDSIILVETRTEFNPVLGAAPLIHTQITDEVFENFVVTRPRFVPKICMQNVACG